MKSLIVMPASNYVAIIPHIQNMYAVEKEKTGWVFGFKYTSGVFEYFSFTSKAEANKEFERVKKAIDDYWMNRITSPNIFFSPKSK